MVRVSERIKTPFHEEQNHVHFSLSDHLFFSLMQIVESGTNYRHEPSQGDVAVFKTLSGKPHKSQYPHAARWYDHVKSYTEDFETLPGDKSTPVTTYGPTVAAAPLVSGPADTAAADDDDDVDLFGSDDEEEDAEAAALKKKRLEEYEKKKAGKTKPAAKSIVTLEVKPWDDTTDMKELESFVRSVEQEGLVWGASKLVPVGYGISKLQINLVVQDELVSLDELQDKLAEDGEEFIQSSDIAAMQKL